MKTYTDEQLQQELDRRKSQRDLAEKPRQIENVDLTALRQICQHQIDELAEHGYTSDDNDNYIYEIAMTTVFGKDVFKWINQKLR